MISTALWEDAKALQIGHAYQQTIDYHRQVPAL